MSNDACTERLTGPGLLANADDLHAHLGTLLASGHAITLDVSGVEAVDVSFLQLMASAALTAERAGQVLTLTGLTPQLQAAFEDAGMALAAGRITLN